MAGACVAAGWVADPSVEDVPSGACVAADCVAGASVEDAPAAACVAATSVESGLVAAPDDDVPIAGTAGGGAVPSSARATAGNISETISVMSAIEVNNRKFLPFFIHFSISGLQQLQIALPDFIPFKLNPALRLAIVRGEPNLCAHERGKTIPTQS